MQEATELYNCTSLRRQNTASARGSPIRDGIAPSGGADPSRASGERECSVAWPAPAGEHAHVGQMHLVTA
jgi:hypothetical protein